jgi:hypothetical protein
MHISLVELEINRFYFFLGILCKHESEDPVNINALLGIFVSRNSIYFDLFYKEIVIWEFENEL